jgi:hypothetical protein
MGLRGEGWEDDEEHLRDLIHRAFEEAGTPGGGEVPGEAEEPGPDAVGDDEVNALSPETIDRILRKVRGDLPIGLPPYRLSLDEPGEAESTGDPPPGAADLPSREDPAPAAPRPARRSTAASAAHLLRVAATLAALVFLTSGMYYVGQQISVRIVGQGGQVTQVHVPDGARVEIVKDGRVVSHFPPPRAGHAPGNPAGEREWIVDDGDPGYSETGTPWRNGSLGGFQGDYRHNIGGSRSAQWTFHDLPPGEYEVSTTWVTHPNRAYLVPFLLFDGATRRARVVVDQSVEPSGTAARGAGWKTLGRFPVASGTLRVELDCMTSKVRRPGSYGGGAVADAVRAVLLTPRAPAAPGVPASPRPLP